MNKIRDNELIKPTWVQSETSTISLSCLDMVKVLWCKRQKMSFNSHLWRAGYKKNIYFDGVKHQKNNSGSNTLPSNTQLNDSNFYKIQVSQFKIFLKTHLLASLAGFIVDNSRKKHDVVSTYIRRLLTLPSLIIFHWLFFILLIINTLLTDVHTERSY